MILIGGESDLKKIPFTKMSGCGNDFIIIDNRQGIMNDFELSGFVKIVCTRRFHLGADGLMLLEHSTKADFKMRYFNADGSEGEMCGNGARCIARYAFDLGIAGEAMSFETLNGIYEGRIRNERVRITFPPVAIQQCFLNQPFPEVADGSVYHFAWVGVPHTVCMNNRIHQIGEQEFIDWARPIRHNPAISKNGTNVNLIEIVDEHHIKIRTYERGVEDETFACGSGATAAAVLSGLLGRVASPVHMQTKGGTLTIAYRIAEECVEEITLEGNAVTVAEGELLPDAGYCGNC